MTRICYHKFAIPIQIVLALVCEAGALAQYRLAIVAVDKDTSFTARGIGLQTSFKNRPACAAYVGGITTQLQARGYPAASVDSIRYDTTAATLYLFLGERYQVALISTAGIDKKILEQSGWGERNRNHTDPDMSRLQELQQKMLDHLENTGYPFARLQLDSITLDEGKLYAKLLVDKGRLYTIDSIRLFGNVKISNTFLQHYLDIRNGSIYQKSRLTAISKKILELPYLQEQQPWNLTMLGTGAIVDLYLQPKKSNLVNVLLGFIPSSAQTGATRLLLTGEATINLRNALGYGETIGLNWQQLQVKSPRLNLSYQQPYLLGSPFGITTTFDLFKKDSSYLNLNFLLGIQYAVSGEQTGRVFLQTLQTNLLNVDTNQVKAARKLPEQLDVRTINLGVDYDVNTTNYRFNPRRGSSLQVTASAGTRKVRRNNVIVKLFDPSFLFSSLYDSLSKSDYQFRVNLVAAHYFPLGRQSTLKTGISAAWVQSPTLYRNELYQIGGYKLLRGFDEESIFASQYLVATVEYRYLIGLNSFVFTFADAGRVAHTTNRLNQTHSYISGGLGLAFETRAGIFNISYAGGTRNDSRLNLRQSKIHLGYVNFF